MHQSDSIGNYQLTAKTSEITLPHRKLIVWELKMMSLHAQQRSQQRGIPCTVIDILLDCGVSEHSKRGVEVFYLNKRTKIAAAMHMKEIGLKNIDQCLNAYLVESSDGCIITVGHRTKKINRN